jgi:hypothetical protein
MKRLSEICRGEIVAMIVSKYMLKESG